MKTGTIICNHWAGESNPIKYFVYTGIKKRLWYRVIFKRWKTQRGKSLQKRY